MTTDSNSKLQDLKEVVKHVMSFEHIPTLRGIEIFWTDNYNTINLIYYNDGPLTNEIEDDLSCIGTEVISHFRSEKIHEEIKQVSSFQKLPDNKYWAYLRSS